MDDYLTTKELAEKLKVSVHTINMWVHKKTIPVFKAGHSNRFPVAVINRWIAKRTHQPKSREYILKESEVMA